MFKIVRFPKKLESFFEPLRDSFLWNHFEYFRMLVLLVAQSDESERPFRRIRTPGSRSAGRWNLYPRRPPGSSGASSRHFALYRTRRTTSSWGQLWVAAVGRRRLATSGRPRRGTRRGRPRNDSEGRPGGTRRPLASRYLGLGEDMDSRGGLWPAPGSTISPGHDPR